jgi:hypothetical protein
MPKMDICSPWWMRIAPLAVEPLMDKALRDSETGKWWFCALPLLAASSKPGQT